MNGQPPPFLLEFAKSVTTFIAQVCSDLPEGDLVIEGVAQGQLPMKVVYELKLSDEHTVHLYAVVDGEERLIWSAGAL